MTLKRINRGVLAVLLLASGHVMAQSDMDNCWTSEIPAQLIDVDGAGRVSGAWTLPQSLVRLRLQQVKVPTGILVSGYDLLAARQICSELTVAKSSQARLVFGGRELLLAKQGAPAWEWLMVSADSVAANLLGGQLSAIFVGDGKAVVGKGFEKSALTDPARLAASLMETHQAHSRPVVLFVGAEHQQRFFEFFSNNPMPGVFLSFDQAEVVRDVLNKQAKFASRDRDAPFDYYCY